MKEVKRQAKKGEYIKIIEPFFTFNRKGDILKVHKVYEERVGVMEKDHPRSKNREDMCGEDKYLWNYPTNKYVVLEGYRKGENMRKFTKNDLKKGDILTFRNGNKGIWDGEKAITGVCSALQKYQISKDLTNTGNCGEDLDIIKVERVNVSKVLYERKKEILDEAEKKYLSQVIRPFRKKVKCIELKYYDSERIYMKIYLKENDAMSLPNFKKGTMYKDMELDREYTLKELGL